MERLRLHELLHRPARPTIQLPSTPSVWWRAWSVLQALQGLADSESHRAQIGLLGSVYEPGGHSCSPSKLNQACALLEGSSPSVTSKNHLGKHTVALPLSGKISGKGMACTGDASKCSNDACSKPGVHLCSRCRGAKYCSAACQKAHWKQGWPQARMHPCWPPWCGHQDGGSDGSACWSESRIVCGHVHHLP